MRTEFLKSFDGLDINVYIWDQVINPKGVVQIIHGLSEHAKRYEQLAMALNSAGFIVYADDHRGHGLTCKDKLGTYQWETIFNDSVKDEILVSRTIASRYQTLPLYIYAHGYGSFLAQSYISRSDIHEKVILSGSAYVKHIPQLMFARMKAKSGWSSKGRDKTGFEVMQYLNGIFEKKVKSGSWLNTIPEEVEKYHRDSYCGFICSYGVYSDIFESFKTLYKKDGSKVINVNKPILMVSGGNDPLGDNGKLVKKLYDYYAHLGVKDVAYKLYPFNRHDIFNDVSKINVFNDIVTFLNKK